MYVIIGLLAVLGLLITGVWASLADRIEDLFALLPVDLGELDARRALRVVLAGGVLFALAGQFLQGSLTPLATILLSAIFAGTTCLTIFLVSAWLSTQSCRRDFSPSLLVGCQGRMIEPGPDGQSQVLVVRGEIAGVWLAEGEAPVGAAVVVERVENRRLWVRPLPSTQPAARLPRLRRR